MRIISKFKDFYDYLNPDNDPDITYVRKTEAIYDPKLSIELDKLITNSLGRFRNFFPVKVIGPNFRIFISTVVYGIYPNIYRIPFICYLGNVYPISEKLFENMKTVKENELDKLIKSYLRDLNRKKNTDVNFDNGKLDYPRGIKQNINDMVKMAECREIFTKIGSPVFIRLRTPYDNSASMIIGSNNPYASLENYSLENGKVKYIKDVVFNLLDLNVIPFFSEEIININTPINIENFLWSIKQEPEAKPDNKTKIEAHGFDVKTSFRKM